MRCLGNTPAVARASYIDPLVIEVYESGITIAPALRDLGRNSEFGDLATRGAAERAAVRMLTSHGDLNGGESPGLGLSPQAGEAAREHLIANTRGGKHAKRFRRAS